MTLSYAESTLISERFDDCFDEVKDILDSINSQVSAGQKVSYGTAKFANANNKFRETLAKMGAKK